MIKAVLWDFGGVILSSPFETFNRYEEEHGLPKDFLRTVNATNPDRNAWARLERSDITPAQFDQAFAEESEALGHRVPGADVLALLAGDVRDEMVTLLDDLKSRGYLLACLTNNVGGTHASGARAETINAIMARFDVVVESSKVGTRKPEAEFYDMACKLLSVEPRECVFLDDLGVNLKPAAAMGMKTIKVVSAEQAIADLHKVLGH
jgi:putative hydrolase of the HAD superfamily